MSRGSDWANYRSNDPRRRRVSVTMGHSRDALTGILYVLSSYDPATGIMHVAASSPDPAWASERLNAYSEANPSRVYTLSAVVNTAHVARIASCAAA